ncbi:MAG: folate-binding protein [Polaromonas sp.]|uniref:CAF17-like 4Fe-4S cluster assembly/insertion protein YgfZ n=1 Tax=Polaromonas sp. TaxID=1869339 RepID=UPI00271DE300|nr:folate-binding protein [Polaromonas sp.]MDO9114816.1 folate-binding protein [Polaromonas sp.]MDP1887627.1 folate-binding protein [Polaromonas sp.]
MLTFPSDSPPSPAASLPLAPLPSGVAELTHLGVIRVAGEEAAKFLQGQLTQDVALLGLSEARLAAFCNAKGRMQASFIVFKRSADEILLVCSRDILPATLKRLSMFVLRAKARLSDATTEYTLCGLAGDAIETIAGGAHPAWAKLDFDEANLVFLHPGAGQPRALWCAPTGTPASAGAVLPLAHWHWLEVQSGIAMITQPIFEAFVPQMLNYESVGGVSFKKGCYPGQEIVARSQFRGTLKRRAYVAHTDGTPQVGQEVVHAADAEQPCGLVAACAPHPTAGFDVIVSLQTAAAADAEGGRLTLGNANGPALALLPLPYALLEDI